MYLGLDDNVSLQAVIQHEYGLKEKEVSMHRMFMLYFVPHFLVFCQSVLGLAPLIEPLSFPIFI